uniref:Uncharacterized protein n=1 Tax=Anguilla anguilla TaxID=7936 RepID=A0A0E9XQZ9_ANGAN
MTVEYIMVHLSVVTMCLYFNGKSLQCVLFLDQNKYLDKCQSCRFR